MLLHQGIPPGPLRDSDLPFDLPDGVKTCFGVVFGVVFLSIVGWSWLRFAKELYKRRSTILWKLFERENRLAPGTSRTPEDPAPHAPPRPGSIKREPFGNALHQVAEHLGGRRWKNSVVFTTHNRKGRIYLYGPGKRGWESGCTSIQVDVRDLSHGVLKVFSKNLKFPAIHGTQEVTIGQREFDSAFVLQTKPAELGKSVFSGAEGSRLLKAISKFPRMYSLIIDLTKETLYVRITHCVDEPRVILDLAEVADTLLGILLEHGAENGITWVSATGVVGGQCQVCGDELASNVVYCRSCRTPHHQECWEYNVVCSTYACQCGRFSRT